MQIYRASHAHAYLLVFKAFKSVVDKAAAAATGEAAGNNNAPGHEHEHEHEHEHQPRQAPLDGPTCYALELLLLLLGLYWMQNDMGDFVEDGMLVVGTPCGFQFRDGPLVACTKEVPILDALLQASFGGSCTVEAATGEVRCCSLP